MRLRLFLAVVATALASAGLVAADLHSLATMAVQGALDPLVVEFQQQTRHTVQVSYDTGPNLARRLASGQAGDILIAPAAVVEQAVKDGRVIAATRVTIGEVGVGVAVRQGSAVPDISTPDALRRALLAADAVLYSQGTSGAYVATLLNTLGVMDQIKAKTTQLANGGVVLEQVIEDRRNTIGFTMVSEIRLMEPRGAKLAGPLPAAVQNYTTYAAAVMTTASDAGAARAFLSHITSPEAKTRLRATGWR